MVVVIILVIIAGWLLTRKKHEEKTWKLPDSSVLSLAKVTYGTNHQVRYGTRWQDFLHPVLPAKLQAKFGAKLATHTSSSNSIVLWLWQRQTPPPGAGVFPGLFLATPFQIATMDSNGLESDLLSSSNSRYRASAYSMISGWELKDYPRRSKTIGIKIYCSDAEGKLWPIGEFQIENKFQVKTGGWLAEALPATRATNGLELTLVKLETGITKKESGMGPAGGWAKSFSRAVFRMSDNGKQTDGWSVTCIKANAASGEVRPEGGNSSRWIRDEQHYAFEGPLWLEEPAWKLAVEISRTRDFPVGELWTIKGVPIPETGKVAEINATTNIYGAEIVFQGISTAKAKLPQEWARTPLYVNLHASNPIPMSDTKLWLVDVKADLGGKVKVVGDTWQSSTGGRGATLKELNHGFGIEIPEGAKSLDVTLAFSKSRYVEFLAKPVLAKN